MVGEKDKIICVMDGDCALCSFGARMIARYDHADQIRIATVQSDLGADLLTKTGLDPDDPETWLVTDGNQVLIKADAVIYLARILGGPARAILPLAWLPRAWRNKLYGVVARNRYRMFGRAKMCDLPDPNLQRKLLD